MMGTWCHGHLPRFGKQHGYFGKVYVGHFLKLKCDNIEFKGNVRLIFKKRAIWAIYAHLKK